MPPYTGPQEHFAARHLQFAMSRKCNMTCLPYDLYNPSSWHVPTDLCKPTCLLCYAVFFMVPGILASQLQTLSMGQTYLEPFMFTNPGA